MTWIKSIKSKIYMSIDVSDDLSNITTYDAKKEIDVLEVGMTAQGVKDIWTCVENLYQTGIYPGISLYGFSPWRCSYATA